MSLGGKRARVVLVQTPTQYLMPLSEFLSTEKSWECFEFQKNLDDAWREVITKSPDLTVFFFPTVTEREKRIIGRVVIGCRSKIFVVTYKRPAQDIDNGGRVEVCVISGPESARSAIYALTRAIDNIGAHPTGTTVLHQPVSAYSNFLIAVGASTGGTEALEKVFRRLPADAPGIVVVQHMPPVFTKLYANRLNDGLPHTVTEAEDNILIKPGTIHIAPGDRHLTVKRRGTSFYTSLGGTAKVSGHCPSVDVLFESVASEAGARSVGVILTGMGADGAAGLLSMRKRGAYTIGQDEASCVVYGMPMKAFECGAVVRQVTLLDIPKAIMAHVSR